MAPIWHKLAQILLLVLVFRFLWRVVQVSVKATTRGFTGWEDEGKAKGRKAVLHLISSPSPGVSAQASNYWVAKDVVTIGRSPDNDVVLSDPFVSLQHARIVRKRGRYYLEDVKSTNHTYVNGKMVDSPCLLREGDTIELGETIFRFLYHVPDDAKSLVSTEN